MLAICQLAADTPRQALDPAELRDVVRAGSDDVRACYTEHPSEADADSYPKIAFTIGGTGDVIEVELSNMGSSARAECVRRVILSWKFPAPRGGGSVRVSYP